MEGLKEKRKFKRIKGDSIVRFKGPNFEIYSNMSNVGEGGLFLNTCYALEEGEAIDLYFELTHFVLKNLKHICYIKFYHLLYQV